MRISYFFAFVLVFMSSVAFAGPLADAAKKGEIAEIKRLIALGVDVNEPTSALSPLHLAAMNGHADAVRLLVDSGAVLDSQNSMLGAPLHAAARFGRVAAARELISAGADLNIRDRDEFTPLMRAIVENRREVIEFLVSKGADVNAIGNAPGGLQLGSGATIALQLAIRFERADIADLLRTAGAGAMPPEIPKALSTQGDPERGREQAYIRCNECHALEPGDEPREAADDGPPLIGVIGRPVADLSGFAYSDALTSYGGTWTPERFYAFVLTPALTVPGTRMNFSPDRTTEMVTDITAYFISMAE